MTRSARTDQCISDFESHEGQKIDSLFRSSWRRIVTILVTVNLAFEATLAGATIHYVSPAGSPAPERDDPARPWQLVEAAEAALPPGSGELRLYPGVYREAMTLSRACVLTTATVGSATIGDRAGVAATTSFNVFTWNTHLAGDEVFLASWLDNTRASEMGDYFRLRRPQLDLVSLCEVWDEDLFLGGAGAQGIRPTAGYANGMHGTRVDNQSEGCLFIPGIPPTVLNSGLAMMTDHPMSDTIQVSFGDCDGSCPTDSSPDCLASKGFIVATVVKDGFTLRIYNTHTQAGNGGDAVEARQNQIDQMAAHISSYRDANPSHLVIVMGDLNVIGETAGQYHFLRDKFGAVGGLDAARNAATTSIYNDWRLGDTLTSFNELALYFDDTPYNQRLDYVWYFPSRDGHIRIQPTYVDSPRVRGAFVGEDGLGSDELSDHYPLEAHFRLDRLE